MIDWAQASGKVDATRVGTVGFSIGSMWSLLAASTDARIKAVYDLGAPINTRMFARVPFLIKSKMCQITGAQTQAQIAAVLARNAIDSEAILRRIDAAIRITHGRRDRVVSMADKQWLYETLRALGKAEASLLVFDDGDHCCTNHIPEVHRDMVDHFRTYLNGA